MGVLKMSDHIMIMMKMLNPSQALSPSKSRIRAKIWIMGLPKTNGHSQIKVKIPIPSQDPPLFSKAQNQDFKDMNVLCTFEIKIELNFAIWVYQRSLTISKSRSRCQPPVENLQQNWKHGCIKTGEHIQIKIKMPNLSQEPPVSSKALNHDSKDMDVLCTVKIRRESPNLNHRCIKDQ